MEPLIPKDTRAFARFGVYRKPTDDEIEVLYTADRFRETLCLLMQGRKD